MPAEPRRVAPSQETAQRELRPPTAEASAPIPKYSPKRGCRQAPWSLRDSLEMISHLGRCDIISGQWARGRAERVRERRHDPPVPDPARRGTAQRELRPPTAEVSAPAAKHSPKRGGREAPWPPRDSLEMISHLGRCDIISRQRARVRAEHVRERMRRTPGLDPAPRGAAAVSALEGVQSCPPSRREWPPRRKRLSGSFALPGRRRLCSF